MKSTKFMSAAEKKKVLKGWPRFLESDFSQAKFTKQLYNHLIQHCSFIAHYNQAGFYGTYFEDPGDTMKFLKQFDQDHDCYLHRKEARFLETELHLKRIDEKILAVKL